MYSLYNRYAIGIALIMTMVTLQIMGDTPLRRAHYYCRDYDKEGSLIGVHEQDGALLTLWCSCKKIPENSEKCKKQARECHASCSFSSHESNPVSLCDLWYSKHEEHYGDHKPRREKLDEMVKHSCRHS